VSWNRWRRSSPSGRHHEVCQGKGGSINYRAQSIVCSSTRQSIRDLGSKYSKKTRGGNVCRAGPNKSVVPYWLDADLGPSQAKPTTAAQKLNR